MAKIVTISVKDSELSIWRQFVSIAKVEGRTASELVMKFVKDYVSRHAKNPAVPLDEWVEKPSFALFPTLGEAPTLKKLKEFPKHMLHELRNNAKAYHEAAEILLNYLEKHDSMHKQFKLVEKYCPYCEQE